MTWVDVVERNDDEPALVRGVVEQVVIGPGGIVGEGERDRAVADVGADTHGREPFVVRRLAAHEQAGRDRGQVASNSPYEKKKAGLSSLVDPDRSAVRARRPDLLNTKA